MHANQMLLPLSVTSSRVGPENSQLTFLAALSKLNLL